jgi:hypothetical protein
MDNVQKHNSCTEDQYYQYSKVHNINAMKLLNLFKNAQDPVNSEHFTWFILVRHTSNWIVVYKSMYILVLVKKCNIHIYDMVIVVSICFDNILLKMVVLTETCKG